MNRSVADSSAQLLMAVRTADRTRADVLIGELADVTPEQLAGSLTDDAARVATWLNLYNAATQLLVEAHAGDLVGRVRFVTRARFFRRTAIVVAGRALSLDAIEHGLLRRSRWKLGLGWLGNPFPGPFERRFRVAAVDPRIHFALNCGAASCPPIAAYDPSRLDAQLDLATRGYLAAAVRAQGDQLVVPRLFLWFMGDFGGPWQIRRFLARHGVEPGRARLSFAPYDWSLRPGAWVDRVASGESGESGGDLDRP